MKRLRPAACVVPSTRLACRNLSFRRQQRGHSSFVRWLATHPDRAPRLSDRLGGHVTTLVTIDTDPGTDRHLPQAAANDIKCGRCSLQATAACRPRARRFVKARERMISLCAETLFRTGGWIDKSTFARPPPAHL